MIIPNKREFLARSMRDAGLLALLERSARRPGLLVLTYHRLGEPGETTLYAPVVSATPETFREQLSRLKRTHRVVSLEEAESLAESGFETREPLALVTFDDGTRDHLERAVPVLKDLGLPAAFFVSTALVDAPRLPWYDLVSAAVHASRVGVLRLDRPEPLELDLQRAGPEAAISRVVRTCLDHDIDVNDEPGFRAHLRERAEVDLDEDLLARNLFLGWEGVRALADAGMSVGSHGHTHRMLARLNEQDQREELSRSKAELESRLSRPERSVAYPYGWPGAFDATTERLAREAGYALGFASVEGFNRPQTTDPLAVRRLGVGFADSPILLRARAALQTSFGRSFV
ncbi:MAG: polysaccharide deacetylase family protein [Isosphaeraceae bacterium]